MRTDFFNRVHAVISAGRALVDDQTASIAPEVYADMAYDGSLIKAGTRINWNGTLKRAAVDQWDMEINNPDNAPTLWEDIAYKGGIRIIPEVITAGTAFTKGEQGWWGDVLYTSLIDANVWTPEAYPDGWERTDE
jgi:hypothetical protein